MWAATESGDWGRTYGDLRSLLRDRRGCRWPRASGRPWTCSAGKGPKMTATPQRVSVRPPTSTSWPPSVASRPAPRSAAWIHRMRCLFEPWPGSRKTAVHSRRSSGIYNGIGRHGCHAHLCDRLRVAGQRRTVRKGQFVERRARRPRLRTYAGCHRAPCAGAGRHTTMIV